MNEQERQDAFLDLMGSRTKADKLYRLLQNTYPKYCSLNGGYPTQHTREEVFEAKALEEGFTKKQISALLAL